MTDRVERARMRAYEDGRAAYHLGKLHESCKRKPGTIYFDDWHDGFQEAEQDERRTL